MIGRMESVCLDLARLLQKADCAPQCCTKHWGWKNQIGEASVMLYWFRKLVLELKGIVQIAAEKGL